MPRPLLLDLFCCAGGAGKGYYEAGFDVIGVDIRLQPHYPFAFHQADALDVLTMLIDGDEWEGLVLSDFAAIHASPPCQRRAAVTAWRGKRENHPDLLSPTLALLRQQTTVPWVVENVPGESFGQDIHLCGSQFGLPVRRHRWFVTNPPITHLLSPCHHRRTDLAFEHKNELAYADAMGCTWMTSVEGRQAIPPAMTEWIGRQLLASLSLHDEA